MKCYKCGVEYSDKVCKIHMQRCKGKEELKEKYTVEELRDIAKENGVKSYWLKNEETLIEELEGVI